MSRTKLAQAVIALGSAGLGMVAAGGSAAAADRAWPGIEAPIAIEPMTKVDPASATGYFTDPYPIHVPPRWINASLPPSFSGTTKAILRCWHRIEADCFAATPIMVSPGPLVQQAQAQGSTITISENHNIFRDEAGAWHMAATFFVKNPAYPTASHWNVIAHAHPAAASSSVPTEWVADAVLVGSFAKPAKANYDGKYVEDSGTLYLVYSKRLAENPARDGIVAQVLQTPTQPASAVPTVLIEPEDLDGGFNSEIFNGFDPNDQFKLIETGNVTRIEGKYALAYSTGAYDQPDYKAGVAWSDTFLPSKDAVYRKVLRPDPKGVWGQPNHLEVRYLLQAQESAWPNYVAAEVLAPGVPSLVLDETEGYLLYFAGFDPSDAPIVPQTGDFDASHRRPFFVRLRVAIPPGASVGSTSDADLAKWITPLER